jgi:hypothetical protein
MKDTIKRVVVPHLRDRGFRGSFPHFRRCRDDRIDLLSFQFDKYGGAFVVEIGQCPTQGVTTYWGKFVSANKVNVTFVNKRLRLGAKDEQSDHWFRFDNEQDTEKVAREVIRLIDAQAEPWWSSPERQND